MRGLPCLPTVSFLAIVFSPPLARMVSAKKELCRFRHTSRDRYLDHVHEWYRVFAIAFVAKTYSPFPSSRTKRAPLALSSKRAASTRLLKVGSGNVALFIR